MSRSASCLTLFAAALIAGGCSFQQGSQSLLPVTPASHGKTVRFVRLSSHVPGQGKRTEAHIVLTIPRAPERGKAPHFVSPATRSIAVSADGAAPFVFNLGSGSPYCSRVRTGSSVRPDPVYQGPLVCAFKLPTTVGTHVFSFTTYDKRRGKGNALSAHQNVPFTVVQGSNAPLAVTLDGIPNGFKVSLYQPGIQPQPDGTWNVYGNRSIEFSMLPADADGNVIVGPGAPALKMMLGSGAKALLTNPYPSSDPSLYTIRSTYNPSDPTVASPSSFTVTIAPLAGTGTATFTVTVPLVLYVPWIYVTNQYTSTVGVTDEYGVAKTLTAPSPFGGVPDPSGIAYDPVNNRLYVASIGDNTVCVFTLMGAGKNVAGTWSNLSWPSDIVDVATNATDTLFLPNSEIYGARPYPHPNAGGSPVPAAVTAYDVTGRQIATQGTFNGLLYPQGIAYDSNNGRLYVSDSSEDTVLAFTTKGVPVSGYSPNLPDVQYGGVAFDSVTKTLFAVDKDDRTVIEFNEDGQQLGTYGAFPGLTQPNGIAYDPYDGYLYVSDGGTGSVKAFDDNGNSAGISIPSAGSSPNPWGIAVVP